MAVAFLTIQFALTSVATIPFFYWFWVIKNNIESENSRPDPPIDPGITVILPTRNEELYIIRKLETIVDEIIGNGNVNVIVADSDSNDKTRFLAREYLAKSSLISSRWEVLNLKIRGKSAVLNKCMDDISSDIIVISDTDACVEPGWLGVLLERFSEDGIGVISGIEDSESLKGSFFNTFYRRSSNNLRVGESVIESSPILEGSLLAWKTEYLQGFRLNENMNADDSQLSLEAIRRGKRSIIDKRICFKGFDDRKRTAKENMRRAQGLTLSLVNNSDLLIRSSRPRVRPILLNAIFLYVLFPWVILSLILTTIFGLFYNEGVVSLLNSTLFCLFLLLIVMRRGRALLLGISIVIISHLQLIVGKRYSTWEPVRKL